jgi:hypothetical protein
MPTPTNIFIHFDNTTPPIHCCSLAEMEAALDRLHAEKLSSAGPPLSAMISIPDYSVFIGLGAPQSFVMLGAEDDWFTGLSDEGAQGDVKMFYGVNDDSYWGPKHLLSIAVARDAVRYFVEHQQRAPTLHWEH